MSRGILLGNTWDTPGIHMGYTWDTPGIHLGYTWDTPGIHLGLHLGSLHVLHFPTINKFDCLRNANLLRIFRNVLYISDLHHNRTVNV